MAAELEELQPPYSLHSMSSVDSEHDDFEFTDDEDLMQVNKEEVFVLREKKGVIYPSDYKYRDDVGEFHESFIRTPQLLDCMPWNNVSISTTCPRSDLVAQSVR